MFGQVVFVRGICVAAIAVALAAPAVAAPALQFSTAVTPEHNAIKALMEKEGGVTIEDKWLNIAPIDLDLDGTPELFVMAVNTDYFCGTAGCLPMIYKQDGGKWTEIDLGMNEFINSQPSDWTVGDQLVNKHRVLIMTLSRVTSRFIWNAGAYSSDD
jgi:hypothetical protein